MIEKIRRIVLFLVVISFVIFFIYTEYLMYYGDKEYINRQYYGIITEIRTLQGSHDLPDIKINNQWISLDVQDSKVKHYIQLGDYIIKEPGTEIIKVYRKNLKEEWSVLIFK